MQKLAVATIVVTWNQTELTLECLQRLASTCAVENQIWVVDNGSQPSALPRIQDCFPHVHTIRLEENRGFTGGCNVGVQAALASAVDYVFLLNNDALVEENTIPILVSALAADTSLAAVSPKVYYRDTPRTLECVGMKVNPNSGLSRMLGCNELDHGQYDEPADREALFGCALLIRRQAWEQVGQFWEPFFNYAEEVDWCLRARKLGWRLRYIPEALVWHHSNSTLGREAPLILYLLARNQLLLRQRHYHRGWPGLRGIVAAAYWYIHAWSIYMLLRQRKHAHAVELALWDFSLGRTGNRRTKDLQLVRTAKL